MSASKRPKLAPPGAGSRRLGSQPATGAHTGCAAEAPAAQLGLLSEPLQAFLVPHLRLADVQRLGQTCRAARALVLGLPEATLRQLAEARALWPMAGLAGLHTWLSPQRTQGQRLPAPKAGMREQLGLWATQAAAVRAGNLQLSCQLDRLRKVGRVQLSPLADQAAVCPSGDGCTVVLIPLTGPQPDLYSELSAQPPSRILAPPSSRSGEILQAEWSPCGQQLVLVSQEGTSALPRTLRVSTFRGTQLVGSFLEPLKDKEERYPDVHILDEAPTMLLTVSSRSGSRVVASTPQGGVIARHPRVLTARSTATLDGGRILRASAEGDRLFIYSATCVQEISLGRAPAQHDLVLVSSWGSLVSVLLRKFPARARAGQSALLLVDLVQQEVQHSVTLPLDGRGYLAQGAHAVAAVGGGRVTVVGSAGKAMGRKLFSCPGQYPRWDSLGMFLAVAKDDGGLCVLHGASGAAVASFTFRPHWSALRHRWLPDSQGLVVDMPYMCPCCVLRFAS